MTNPTTALAEAKATVPEALDLSTLSVIGLIDGHNGSAALLRSEHGQIARAMTGDSVFGMTVTAIGDDRVLLTDRWGRTQTLGLPHG